MTDLTKLRAEMRAGLEGVTSGPWRHVQHFRSSGSLSRDSVFAKGAGSDIIDDVAQAEDAAHIARCSPDNIRALLDALDDAESHVEMLQEKIDADKSCACSYDTVHDVCLSHSPLLDRAIKERDAAKRIIVACINLGTDGGASEACSMEFLSYAPNECEAVKRQRDEARRERDNGLIRESVVLAGLTEALYKAELERDEARAALDGRFSSKVFCAMLSTGVCDKIDKSDHEAALTRARIEGRIEGMEKAAELVDGCDMSAVAPHERPHVADLEARRIAKLVRALKDRAP